MEEITLEAINPHRFAFSASLTKPVASKEGGLKEKTVESGLAVLSDLEITRLNKLGEEVEQELGYQPNGWDIEWAIDKKGDLFLLQARANM